MSNEPITVILIPKVRKDLEWLKGTLRLSGTDTINRAITLYRFIVEKRKAGYMLVIERHGERLEVKIDDPPVTVRMRDGK